MSRSKQVLRWDSPVYQALCWTATQFNADCKSCAQRRKNPADAAETLSYPITYAQDLLTEVGILLPYICKIPATSFTGTSVTVLDIECDICGNLTPGQETGPSDNGNGGNLIIYPLQDAARNTFVYTETAFTSSCSTGTTCLDPGYNPLALCARECTCNNPAPTHSVVKTVENDITFNAIRKGGAAMSTTLTLLATAVAKPRG